jgi:hypothetical protein
MGPEVGDIECHVGHVLVPMVFVFCHHFGCSQKECGLEVDCRRVQERACAKAGSILRRSTCVVLYLKRANNVL